MPKETFTPSTRLDAATNMVRWKVRFISLPHPMVTHRTFKELSGSSAKLLLAMLSDYTGSNNGHLVATYSRMKAYGFVSKGTIARALKHLIDGKYIVRTRAQKLRSPALYAATWYPINQPPLGLEYEEGISPGNEPLDSWRPNQIVVETGAA
jgi:hypothetical protein